MINIKCCFFSEAPDEPIDVKVTLTNTRTIRVSWKQPYDGNKPITNYILQYKNATGKFLC